MTGSVIDDKQNLKKYLLGRKTSNVHKKRGIDRSGRDINRSIRSIGGPPGSLATATASQVIAQAPHAWTA